MDSSESSDTHTSATATETRRTNLRGALLRSRSLHVFIAKAEGLLKTFSPGDRLVLYGLATLLAGSVLVLLGGLNAMVSVEVPSRGGSVHEGIVGTPRFANPVLAVSGPDQDMTNLVYSGLMRATSDGAFVPDLAETYEISEDGTTYTFTLRDDVRFHDGSRVTPEDVLFTVALAQNPDVKSPRRADWEGVTVSSPDPKTVVFTLPHAYAPFLENATVGILPKLLWSSVAPADIPFSPLNTHPVGSGPYRITDIATDASGAATYVELSAFRGFALGAPNISRIRLTFYPNEKELLDAYQAGDIDSFAAATPSRDFLILGSAAMLRTPLTRVFGVFFNQSHAPVLAETAVRAALDAAVDKRALINDALGGYGVELSGPIPPGLPGAPAEASGTQSAPFTGTEEARGILAKAGWKFNEDTGEWKKGKSTLAVTLATADTPELAASAQRIAQSWRQLGVLVTVHVYPLAELNANIIRPRNYDALLFGEVVGRSLDLFAFWHSSQRNDPGLNLALYANSKTDKILSDARATTDPKERSELYAKFSDTLASEHAAVFLYAPQFIYVVPKKLSGVAVGAMSSPSERYLSVHEWYLSTERVWHLFAKE